MLAASFLVSHYDRFFPSFNRMLLSDNYVTRRQSVKLLGELLLEKANYDVMTRYITNADHLKALMNLLKDPSQNIRLEAFHVFKIFVANPRKSKVVFDILLKNQRRLIEYLEIFQPTKGGTPFHPSSLTTCD